MQFPFQFIFGGLASADGMFPGLFFLSPTTAPMHRTPSSSWLERIKLHAGLSVPIWRVHFRAAPHLFSLWPTCAPSLLLAAVTRPAPLPPITTPSSRLWRLILLQTVAPEGH